MWKWSRKQPSPRPHDDTRLIRRYPELAYFDGADARANAFTTALMAARKGTILWTFLLTIVLNVCWQIPIVLLEQYAPSSWWHRLASVGTMPCMMLAGLIILRIRRRQFDRSLREQLARRGVPICIKCGYDLRGLSEPRCPECGALFNPDLLKPGPPPPSEPATPIETKKKKRTRRERQAAARLTLYPDLILFPSEEREQTWTAGRLGTNAWTKAAIVTICVGEVAVFVLAFWKLPKPPGFSSSFTFPLLIAGIALPFLWLYFYGLAKARNHKCIERFLRRQLNLRGHALCLKCGYDLKGQTEPRCPECGTEFDPALLPHPPTEPPQP